MWNSFKRLITLNPMGMFIYSLLSKWYLTIAMGGLVVAFWVFKGLDKAGVIQAAEHIVSQAINDSKAVAKFCVPRITNISDFWYCLNNLPNYTPEPDENNLETQVEILKQNINERVHSNENPDPYYDAGNSQ